MSERNPQKSVTLSPRELEDLTIVAEYQGVTPASIMRDAWVQYYRSADFQALIKQAKDNRPNE